MSFNKQLKKEAFSKDLYLLGNFSKIKHKPWELYVITRILHLLDDDDLEYICQQPVKQKNSDDYYLTDLCFPSLGLYIEINERQHSEEEHQISDAHRKREIFDATNWCQLDINVYDENDPKRNKSLNEIKDRTDDVIKIIKKRKDELESSGKQILWDYKAKYDPETYIKRGSIDSNDNISFLYTKDALKLFGYRKGHWQSGVWHIKGTNETVWFPKLYNNISSDGVEWLNTLENNFQTIKMQRKVNDKISECPDLLERAIVFAHCKNVLGHVVYRFLGVFEPSPECADGKIFNNGKAEAKSTCNIYHRKETTLNILKYKKN